MSQRNKTVVCYLFLCVDHELSFLTLLLFAVRLWVSPPYRLLRHVRHAKENRNKEWQRQILDARSAWEDFAQPFFPRGSFTVTLEELSDRGTTRNLVHNCNTAFLCTLICRRSIHVVSRNFINHYTYGPVYENGRHSLSTENYWWCRSKNFGM